MLADHFHCSRSFLDVDVTSEASWKKQKAIFQADLFTSSWFLSEITKDLNAALPFFDGMISSAKSGALFLFVDFAHSMVTNLIDGLAETYDLGTPLLEKKYSFRIASSEDKAELGTFIDRFGCPKLTGDVVIRLYRKP